MITLDPKADSLVLINTFTVDPARADELFQALSKATKHGMRQRAGFISASLHLSRDKKHVTNYAQWRSQDDVDAMMSDPTAQAHMKEAAEIADSFEPIYYDLCETHTAPGAE